MVATIVGHILAVGIGMSLGLIGGGGSVLAVPLLVYVMGIEAKKAIAMTLGIVGTVSLVGLVPHWRQGNVNLTTALMFAPPAMVGAYLGAMLASLVTDTFQLIGFGIVMLMASILMIRKGSKNRTPQEMAAKPASSNISKLFVIAAEGLAVGTLSGFVGVGGGFLIIPALVLFGGLPMKEAIGTSLLIIVFKCAGGFLGYLNRIDIDTNSMISLTAAASIGIVGGAYLTEFIDGKKLQKGFGYFILGVALFVLIKR